MKKCGSAPAAREYRKMGRSGAAEAARIYIFSGAAREYGKMAGGFMMVYCFWMEIGGRFRQNDGGKPLDRAARDML